MKKTFLIGLLNTSILMTQCYTLNEYSFKDYNLKNTDELVKVVLTDSTEIELIDNQISHEIRSDKLLIKRQIGEKFGDHTRILTITDTLKSKDIHSIFVSESSQGRAALWGGIIGGVIGGLVTNAMSQKSILGNPIPWSRRQSTVYLGVGLGVLTGATIFALVITID